MVCLVLRGLNVDSQNLIFCTNWGAVKWILKLAAKKGHFKHNLGVTKFSLLKQKSPLTLRLIQKALWIALGNTASYVQ